MLLQKLNGILDSAEHPANPEGQPWPEGMQEVSSQQDQAPPSYAHHLTGAAEPMSTATTRDSAAAAAGNCNSSTPRTISLGSQDNPSAAGEIAAGGGSGGSACGNKGISDWEVVGNGSSSNAPSEMRSRAEDALAEEAARMLRLAASAAEALAPRLPAALRRAEIAEAEVVKLRALLEAAESRMECMKKQQELLTQGFVSEIRQRDAEIATYKAAAAATASSTFVEGASSTTMPPESLDVVTFFAEGPLGIEFDHSNAALKIISLVDENSQSAGRVMPGDEVVSINGVPARSLSWEELADVFSTRPAVVSVRRACPDGGAAQGRGAGPLDRLKLFAGWTGAAVNRAVRAAMTDAEDVERPLDEDEPLDEMASEVRNRPFYELVRASMAEACAQETKATGFLSGDEATFEQWLRQFHSERDDEWYESNHVRVYNAFKPHWDEVVAAQRTIAA